MMVCWVTPSKTLQHSDGVQSPKQRRLSGHTTEGWPGKDGHFDAQSKARSGSAPLMGDRSIASVGRCRRVKPQNRRDDHDSPSHPRGHRASFYPQNLSLRTGGGGEAKVGHRVILVEVCKQGLE